MGRVLIAMSIVGLSAAGGQVLLRVGAQQLGALDTVAPAALAAWFGGAVINPWVIAGTVLNAVCYGLLVAVLSWTGVTVALPLSALEYGFAALLGTTLLGESVPPLRWAGIALVVAGVVLIGAAGGDASA